MSKVGGMNEKKQPEDRVTHCVTVIKNGRF